MNTLAIDIETFSSVDLAKSGVYKYTESPDFEILLMAYKWNSDEIQVVDFTDFECLPARIFAALTDPAVLKTAHNAPFEMCCLNKFLGIELMPEQWECTMAKVAQLGLPLSLDQASKALGISEQKMSEGKKLIRYFCVPCKPTKANGFVHRNYPVYDDVPLETLKKLREGGKDAKPELDKALKQKEVFQMWQKFKEYCVQDVATECGIKEAISFFQFPGEEKKIWCLDYRVNARGIKADEAFIGSAIKIDTEYRQKLTTEAVALTGLDNPNSVAQLKEWLEEETGEDIGTLNKESVPALLKTVESGSARRVLELRQLMSKTSVKKYAAMQAYVAADGRIHGIHQYYGANRTGRWAGRGVQPQNMPKNNLVDLDLAREITAEGDTDWLYTQFGNVPDTVSQLIRTAFVAEKGKRFIVADFSAIEARVIAWLAGEQWRINVFNGHGKIYEASGAQMFKVPIEQVTKGSILRDKAKIAELALGYQGGPNALLKMGSEKMGLKTEELDPLVKMWRAANRKIVQYWYNVQDTVIEAVESGKATLRNITAEVKNGILWIQLPSGRKLSYQSPKLQEGQYNQLISYMGMDQTTKQWKRQDTYGGKLVENIVQATARDLLAYAMLQLSEAGYKIVMHVHDEIICEMPEGQGSAAEMAEIMSRGPVWAKGLPLAADAYETYYYKKD